MVDPVNSSSQAQQILATEKKSSKQAEEKQKSSQGKEVDQVNISDEALSLAEASEAARQTSQALKDNETLNLSSDPNKLKKLV